MRKCAEKNCGNFYKDHRWGHIKAHDEGWFFSKTSKKAWCPDHIPNWVKQYRENKKQDDLMEELSGTIDPHKHGPIITLNDGRQWQLLFDIDDFKYRWVKLEWDPRVIEGLLRAKRQREG